MAAAPFRLDIPPDPAFLATARLFVGATARDLGCDEDAVEDLKLAVSEACAAGMSDDSVRGITIQAEPSTNDLRVEVGPVPRDAPEPTGGEGGPSASELIRLVFRDAEWSDEGDPAPRIRFSVPISSA